MDVENHASIHERIAQLTSRERELKSELAALRRQRASLKARSGEVYLTERPQWISDLPQNFWLPTHAANKVLGGLNPNLENRNVTPDLIDWSKTSGIREFLVNIGITVAVVVVGLQLFFLIL